MHSFFTAINIYNTLYHYYQIFILFTAIIFYTYICNSHFLNISQHVNVAISNNHFSHSRAESDYQDVYRRRGGRVDWSLGV